MPRRKKSDEIGKQQAFDIRQKRADGWKLRELAELYDVSIGMIGKIVRYESHIY